MKSVAKGATQTGPSRPRRSVIHDLAALRIFVAVCETGGFTAAARRQGVTPATVSKQIRDLEDRLGTRLVNRTTRRTTVTDAGQIFYQRCVVVLDSLEAAEMSLMDLKTETQGHLKITAPPGLGAMHLVPQLPGFLKRFPRITLELKLTTELLDLVAEGVDLAIRTGPVNETGVNFIKLAPNRRVVCGTPGYIRARGVPKTPDDLQAHTCIVPSSRNNRWTFQVDGALQNVKVDSNITVDSMQAIHTLTLQGVGLAQLPYYFVEPDLSAGRLVEVLHDHEALTSWIYAVTPNHLHVPRKSREFIQFLQREVVAHLLGSESKAA